MTPSWALSLPWELIRDAASKWSLDPYLIAAIIQKESGGCQWRTKEEVRASQDKNLWYHRAVAEKLGISSETERIAQLHSYSYMQIMGWLARKYGFSGYLSELCSKPEVVLAYGCQLLQELFRRYGNEEDVISAYNFGHLEKTRGGLYVNSAIYVDPVSRFLRELRAI